MDGLTVCLMTRDNNVVKRLDLATWMCALHVQGIQLQVLLLSVHTDTVYDQTVVIPVVLQIPTNVN